MSTHANNTLNLLLKINIIDYVFGFVNMSRVYNPIRITQFAVFCPYFFFELENYYISNTLFVNKNAAVIPVNGLNSFRD